MKTVFILPIVFLLFNCSAKKPTELSTVDFSIDNCPADGDCTVELLKNKRLTVKRDGTGATYYQLLDHQGIDVIRYRYTKKTDAELADAGYREEVVFEIDSKHPEIELTDADIQVTQALFGRFCFCRDAGYYSIVDGQLSVKSRKDEYRINLNFTVPDVPQTINNLQFIAK